MLTLTSPGRQRPAHCPGARRALRRSVVGALAVAAVGAGIAGCGGSAQSASSAANAGSPAQGGTLTVALPSGLPTLDPAKDGYSTYSLMRFLSNEPLFVINQSTGAVDPGLATAYAYAGPHNTVFELSLRHDARFSDGTPVTASTVKAWFDYFAKANGPYATLLPLKSVATPNPWTVRLTFTKPVPNVAFLLAGGGSNWGFVSGPKGIAGGLASNTDGAGPYELVPAASIAGDHYTFVPNPYYYNHSAIKWKKIVVKVISSPSTTLQALQSGQVDAAIGDPTTAATAQSDGLTVRYAPQGWAGIIFTDREGDKSKPLGNVLVRQALNYAVNRTAITKALLGKFGVPTDEWLSTDGLSQAYQAYYPYDPAKARQLLAEAGYPHGFTLPVEDQGYTGNLGDPLVQAVAQDLKAVGVTLKITTEATSASALKAALSQQFPAFAWSWGASPVASDDAEVFNPTGSVNPYHVDDATIDRWDALASQAPQSAASRLWAKTTERMVTQGDQLAVMEFPSLVYARSDVAGVSVSRLFLFSDALAQWSPS